MTAPTSTRAAAPETTIGHAVFDQPWWLDAVAPGRWSEVVVRRGDDVVARLPYVVHERLGMRVLGQPPLTQTLGPWVRPTPGKYAKQLEAEKDLMGELIAGLPRFDAFGQSFSPEVTNWLPFHWAGFEATVLYTYRIEGLEDLDAVWGDFAHNVRRHIRKAEKELEVRAEPDLDALIRLNREIFARQGLPAPYEPEVLRRLDAACAARDARDVLLAVDAHERVHAAAFVVHGHGTSHLLTSGVDTELRSSGAQTLLVWEAIRRSAPRSSRFDFAGSMIESVERFNRAFGSRQVPYLAVERSRPLARALLAARSAARRVTAARRRTTRGGDDG
jgi:ribosomal protein S18 acetylase RimI-like enzyme